MLSFLSGGTSFCDGLTRREVLRVGGWGALGLLGASSPMSVASTSSVPIRFGQAKTVVLVTLYGGPPQTETFDMKPDAPLEVRGPFRPIRTNVVGVEICEHLPRLAGLAHLYTLARSFSHTDTAHGSAIYTFLTGFPSRVPNNNSRSEPDDHPHYGAIMDLAKVHLSGAPTCSVLGGPILPQFGNIGQTGGYLGKAHDPFISKGDPTRLLTLKDGVPALRMQKRQGLLDQLRATQRTLGKHEKTAGFSLVQGHARNLLNSQRFISPSIWTMSQGKPSRDMGTRSWGVTC